MSDTERDKLIDDAIAAGKFPEESRAHYEACYRTNPEGTRKLIEQLASVEGVGGRRPPDATMAPTSGGDGPGYIDQHLTPAERGRIQAERDGRQHSRIVQEL